MTTQPTIAAVWHDTTGAEVLTTTGKRVPVSTPRYRAALEAQAAAEAAAPCILLPEHLLYNAAVLRPVRDEVRAAWIEAAEAFGIDPDIW